MLRFKQFLIEGIVDWYHRTDPATAERFKSGEKIRSQGLSIFLNPEEAAKYNFETSAGHIPPDAKTVTGTVSTRRIIPDIEWHPDSYKPIFKDIAQQIQTNPNFRVPSFTRTSIRPTGILQFVTPGIILEIDPNTGKKAIVRNWEPRFALQYPEGHPHAGYLGEPHELKNFPIKDPVSGELIHIDDPRVKPTIASKSKITPFGKAGPETKAWGGSASTHGRYPEQRDLDVLTRKSDITKITNDAIEQGKRGFRTQGGSGVNVSGIVDPTQAIESTEKLLKGKDVAGKVATTLIDPTQPVIDATVAQVAKTAPKLGNIDILPASRSRIPGPRPVATSIGYGLAGLAGGLAGEHFVKPAAEKAGVFDAIERGTREGLSSMSPWAANVADVGLGVIQTVLDPISATAPLFKAGLDAKEKREVDAAIKAGRPSQVRFRGPKF